MMILDDLGKNILNLIANDARVPFLEVARKCEVSGAAIHQRMQKLQQRVYAHDNAHLLSIIHDKLQPIGIQRSETMNSFHGPVHRQMPICTANG